MKNAHKKAISSGCDDDWSAYRKLRNCVNAKLRVCKADYLRDEYGKKENRQFWRQVSYINGREKIRQFPVDVPDLSNSFNNYFLSSPSRVLSELCGNDDQSQCSDDAMDYLQLVKQPPSGFLLQKVDVVLVSGLIRELDSTKATGLDEMPAVFLKRHSSFLSSVVTKLINRSFQDGVFPRVWKQSIIIPLQKQSNNTSLSNYRPISILPVVFKIIERIVHIQLTDYLNSHQILSPNQSGFRVGHSTQDVLLNVVNSWSSALDRGMFVGALFLDLSKAFDCVNHDILLSKLHFYGIRGMSMTWFRDYLGNRQQRVRVDNLLSDWGEVQCGVPQGSILGPLLFSIYINDLPIIFNNTDINIFADDTELHLSDHSLLSLESNLQKEVDLLCRWSNSNLLKINIQKSAVMLLGPKRKVLDKVLKISINDTPIPFKVSVKYLGVHVNRWLTWDDHVTSIITKVQFKLLMLLRMKPSSPAILLTLYKIYIMPHFDYCSIVWQALSTKLSLRLDKLHIKAMKQLFPSYTVIYSNNLSTPSLPLTRRKYHMMVQTYKILHDLAPPYLRSSVKYSYPNSGRSLRNNYRVIVPVI